VAVDSLVGDWFMDRPLLGDPAAGLEKLRWLIARAAAAGITRIVLPFVDASGVGEDDLDELATTLAAVVPDAEGAGVELHLETPLAPEPFARLLGLLDGDVVKANYDSGNSASLGYDPRQEFGAYGERIGSVHIKDRVLGGTTVPLGEGDADLEAVLWLLRRGGWRRPLVLQVARENPGGEVEKVRSDAELVRAIWSRCGEPAWT
jgi:hexulose-6-phosphate isomerase